MAAFLVELELGGDAGFFEGPVHQLDTISCERNVTADTPPCFFFHAKDDKGVVPENSELMHEALKKAGVTTELKLYQKGGHGFGLGRKGADSTQWPGDLLVWLKHMKVL